MSHGQNLRDLLEPLGVYRWEGTFQWGELQSQGRPWTGWRRNWRASSGR